MTRKRVTYKGRRVVGGSWNAGTLMRQYLKGKAKRVKRRRRR